jgi:putative hemolysin
MADAPATSGDPFTLQFAPATRLRRAAFAVARPFLSWALRLPEYRRLYSVSRALPGTTFEARALNTLGVRLRVHGSGSGEAGIPATGPLIVAANHPTGALDGLLVSEAVRQVRTDVRILTNHLLGCIPELDGRCFFVDPFGGARSAARSQAGLRAAHLWLRQGGTLVVFPAGEVATRDPRVDSAWHPMVGRLALAANAAVLPTFIDARNSRLFYAAGRVHPIARTLLLGRELLNKRGTTVRVFVGSSIGPAAIGKARTAPAATSLIRAATDALARTSMPDPRPVDVEPAVEPSLLAGDVLGLPADAVLLTSGSLDVFCAEAAAIPNVLREIGRLREITFRAAGEGTGRSIDLDRFDEHYQHLVVWNRDTREVVGAYRIGATDRIVPSAGPEGLYTSTLFRYDERLLERLSPALELGRSFVRAEYQRSYAALLLLWKGIGRLIARAPRYRVLFGPVSISSRYQDLTQQMLRAFLAEAHSDEQLASLVEPLNPPSPIAPPAREAARVADIDDLDALIRRLEGTQGIPVLLRQYLRLKATLLGFNVDPAFGDALDALMMVDLTSVPAATLQRYLGRQETAAFLAHHGARDARPAAA